MNLFEEALKSSYNEIEDIHEGIFESIEDILEETYGDDEITADMLKEDFDLTDEEAEEVMENMVRRVSADGSVKKMKSAAVRKRRAGITTGLSTAQRKMIGRKAARTRKRNPSIVRKANKKRRRALNKRKKLGIK